MTAPDHVIKPTKNFLRGRGHPYMAFDLDGAAHAHEPGAELVLHPGIDAFGHGAEIEEPVVRVRDADAPHAGDLLGAFGFRFMLRTKIAVDQRRMAERLAVPVDDFGVVGCVHRLIEIDDAGAGHGHEGNGDLAVVHGGRGQHAGDGDLAAGDVEMQLVADPCLLIALAVLLAADVAGGGQLGEHFRKALRGLPFEARRLRLWPLLALSRASAPFWRLGGGRRRIVFPVFLDGLLARFDLGGVAGDDADDAPLERALDQRRVHPARQIALRELVEGAGKGGFVRNLRTPLPPADSAQRLVGLQAFDQGAGGWNAEQSLGDEASGQGAAILGWAARASRRLWNEGLETDHVEDGDEPAELFGHRLDFLAKPREKRGLYVIPARPHGVERIVSHLVRRHGA